MNTCEYLARIGFSFLCGTPTEPLDPDDQNCIEEAFTFDHRRVKSFLGDLIASPMTGRSGVRLASVMDITWPDLVPDLKTWAGQQTLDKMINKLASAVRDSKENNPFSLRMPIRGATGFDSLSCGDAIDIGFSPAALDMEVMQRPALELLAIIGLEQVPIICFGKRVCGFIHDEKVWQFPVEARDGGYYHRWGGLSRV